MSKSIFKEMEELRNKWQDFELTDEQNDKLKGDCQPGCRITIYWRNDAKGYVDHGYTFSLAGMDHELGDCFVHVPQTDNWGGKEAGRPEWGYLIALQANKFVEKIVCKP